MITQNDYKQTIYEKINEIKMDQHK